MQVIDGIMALIGMRVGLFQGKSLKKATFPLTKGFWVIKCHPFFD